MKIITVAFTAKPEKQNEIIELCVGMIQPSRNEPGCISYIFYQNVAEKNKFFFFEEWKDQSAIDFHVTTKHYKDFVPKFETMITGSADLQIRSVE